MVAPSNTGEKGNADPATCPRKPVTSCHDGVTPPLFWVRWIFLSGEPRPMMASTVGPTEMDGAARAGALPLNEATVVGLKVVALCDAEVKPEPFEKNQVVLLPLTPVSAVVPARTAPEA